MLAGSGTLNMVTRLMIALEAIVVVRLPLEWTGFRVWYGSVGWCLRKHSVV